MRCQAGIALAVAVAASCAKREGAERSPHASGPASDLLDSAHVEIREALYPSYDDMGYEELTSRAGKAIQRAFEPRMAELVGVGAQHYLALPEASVELSEYKPIDSERAGIGPDALVDLAADQEQGVMLKLSWNPLPLASLCRTVILARELGVEEMKKLMALGNAAPPRMSRLGSDPRNPQVVFEEPGDRLTIVTLALRGHRFVPLRVQRMKRR